MGKEEAMRKKKGASRRKGKLIFGEGEGLANGEK